MRPTVAAGARMLTDGQPLIARADIAFSGRLNLSATGRRWRPFGAGQCIVASPPGFVWDARVAFLPGLAVRVVDAYLAGRGRLDAALLGLASVAHVKGTGETARAELIRCLAEFAWLPTALLPSQGVQWEGVDANTARTTIVDGAHTVSLRVRFDATGPIESVHVDDRAAVIGGRVVMLPWEGRWSGYRKCQGMTVPMRGEAAWLGADGRRPYYEGTVTSLRYELATPRGVDSAAVLHHND